MGEFWAFMLGMMFAENTSSGCGRMGSVDKMKRRESNANWAAHNYSFAAQHNYDYNLAKLMDNYDFKKIGDAIRRDYPRMNDMWVSRITKAAVAKRMMEEETSYDYCVESSLRDANIDLTRYALDEFKKS